MELKLISFRPKALFQSIALHDRRLQSHRSLGASILDDSLLSETTILASYLGSLQHHPSDLETVVTVVRLVGRRPAGMAPPRAPLAQSESKARFFERLGMDEQSEGHQRLYAMMKVTLLAHVLVYVPPTDKRLEGGSS